MLDTALTVAALVALAAAFLTQRHANYCAPSRHYARYVAATALLFAASAGSFAATWSRLGAYAAAAAGVLAVVAVWYLAYILSAARHAPVRDR